MTKSSHSDNEEEIELYVLAHFTHVNYIVLKLSFAVTQNSICQNITDEGTQNPSTKFIEYGANSVTISRKNRRQCRATTAYSEQDEFISIIKKINQVHLVTSSD